MTEQIPLIQGTFSDFKTVKTRKVLQVIIEVPLEKTSDVIKILGSPQPHAETPVAIARLKVDPGKQQKQQETQNFSVPQRVAITCGEGLFHKFLHEKGLNIPSPDHAAQHVRNVCGVTSRKDIQPGTIAFRKWDKLYGEYLAWKEAI